MGHWKTWKSVVPQAAASTQNQICIGLSHSHYTKVFFPFLKIYVTVPAPCEILIKKKL